MRLYSMFSIAAGYEQRMARYIGVSTLTPISSAPFFSYSHAFVNWWKDYYTNDILYVCDFTTQPKRAFAFMYECFQKGTTPHIKAIPGFQKSFDLAYGVDDLS